MSEARGDRDELGPGRDARAVAWAPGAGGHAVAEGEASRGPGSRHGRWGCVAALALGVAALAWLVGGAPGATPRASAGVVAAVGAALGEGWRRDAPPIDLEAAARYARGVPGLPVPADRVAAAWRGPDGSQVLAVALVLDDEAAARELLAGRATELVAATYDLRREALDLPPFAEAVAFTAPAYRAAAARRGRTVLLVGATLPSVARPEALVAAGLAAAAGEAGIGVAPPRSSPSARAGEPLPHPGGSGILASLRPRAGHPQPTTTVNARTRVARSRAALRARPLRRTPDTERRDPNQSPPARTGPPPHRPRGPAPTTCKEHGSP